MSYHNQHAPPPSTPLDDLADTLTDELVLLALEHGGWTPWGTAAALDVISRYLTCGGQDHPSE